MSYLIERVLERFGGRLRRDLDAREDSHFEVVADAKRLDLCVLRIQPSVRHESEPVSVVELAEAASALGVNSTDDSWRSAWMAEATAMPTWGSRSASSASSSQSR